MIEIMIILAVIVIFILIGAVAKYFERQAEKRRDEFWGHSVSTSRKKPIVQSTYTPPGYPERRRKRQVEQQSDDSFVLQDVDLSSMRISEPEESHDRFMGGGGEFSGGGASESLGDVIGGAIESISSSND